MSIVCSVGSTWKGFPAIRRLVIFGDSYSSVEHLLSHDESIPNAADPLGVPFPGSASFGLWNEESMPNWVGHLITKHRPGPRYMPPKKAHQPGKRHDQSKAWIEHPLIVNDYARGGDTIAGVSRQIRSLYLPGLGKKPITAPWTAEDTLFVTWVGINDCAYQVKDDIMEDLFALEDEVYNTGARIFLFIDVPPINRSPAVPNEHEDKVRKTYEQWNLNLLEAAESFSSTHENSSVFFFSSFKLFSDLLDNPVSFGFNEEDARRRGGKFWKDHIHPTSKVHGYIASSLAEFLLGIPTNDNTLTILQPYQEVPNLSDRVRAFFQSKRGG